MDKVNVNIIGVFPTPILQGTLGRDFTEQELQYVENLERIPNVGGLNRVSVNGFVLADKEMDNLEKDIYKFIEEYKQTITDPKGDLDFRITHSWLNWTETGENHHTHTHPNSYLSGVIYLNAVEGDNISFENPERKIFDITPNQHNQYNSNSWDFNVVTGDIYIFPSTLHHHVPHRSVEGVVRISLAFNIYPRGLLGEFEVKTGLFL